MAAQHHILKRGYAVWFKPWEVTPLVACVSFALGFLVYKGTRHLTMNPESQLFAKDRQARIKDVGARGDAWRAQWEAHTDNIRRDDMGGRPDPSPIGVFGDRGEARV